MWDESCREKMSNTLKSKRHKPPVQGGNGKPTAIPQQLLAETLGWGIEYIEATGMPRGSGYPPHYKIDIANVKLKIAIEVDGASHNALARKAQDKKKEEFLKSQGWFVLRFTNKEVMGNLQECVQTVMSTMLKLKPMETILQME